MTDDISVSFKVGTGFDAPLFNFKGETGYAVQARLIEFFQLGNAAFDLSPFEAFVEAGLHAKAVYAASNGVGAKPETAKPAERTYVAAKPDAKTAKALLSTLNAEPVAERTPTANGAGFTAPVVEQPHALLIASIDSAADEASLFALARENKTVWSGDVRAAADKRLAELRAA